ncbi:helix-turn-helix domain-containing protein [Leucobacter sp. UCMA 4100]|uniref:helix-turn-helix transcriptional regulator n=1 Tax=Leucobacter sp. UCMA 4100 TaxID=2810534 RepID=UPI0022EB0E6F|nr:AraC family transcriptional regulator [Leucobacter sp. UCMA 4100]MDA3148174.1 helix-turn-helix domain-containing protein [Leucobacter sp. UCMA 4100]
MTTPSRGAWAREPHTFIVDEIDSPTSVESPFSIAVERAFIPVPLEFEPHAHRLHELVWVCDGTMTVKLPDRVVTIPEGQGLWIPAHTVHSGRVTAGASLIDALFEPARSPLDFAEPVAVRITPLVASLLTHLEQSSLSVDERCRAEAVVFDVVEPSPHQLSLRLPGEGHITVIVEALVQDPTNTRSLAEWAEQVGISDRTVARLFRKHTGLSFLQWRQVLRIHHAVALLSEGLSVNETSEQLGFSQPSTFIASFKRVLGTTPGSYTSTVSDSPHSLS